MSKEGGERGGCCTASCRHAPFARQALRCPGRFECTRWTNAVVAAAQCHALSQDYNGCLSSLVITSPSPRPACPLPPLVSAPLPFPPQAMIKVVFLVAVIAIVGSQAPAPFHSFNKGGAANTHAHMRARSHTCVRSHACSLAHARAQADAHPRLFTQHPQHCASTPGCLSAGCIAEPM